MDAGTARSNAAAGIIHDIRRGIGSELTPTKSLDLASLVEAKAIEKVGKTVYFEHLCYVTQDATWRPEYEKREVAFILSLVTATALQRCTAARAAVEGI